MQKLENDVNEIMRDINQNWVDAIKDAEKNNTGIDMADMFGKYAAIVARKEKAFQDASIRAIERKKGFFK